MSMTTLRQRWKTLLRATVLVAALLCSGHVLAAKVSCLKTNTGQYIELARVSMMVVPDGGSTFEIVVSEGDGATGVESISFEWYDREASGTDPVDDPSDDPIDQPGDDPGDTPVVDPGNDPVFAAYLFTSSGKYYKLSALPVLKPRQGSSNFDVVVGSETDSDVSSVYFYRGEMPDISAIDSPATASATEKLTLKTPISTQMVISGCGSAPKATIYAANGSQVAEAQVVNGVTTLHVAHLPAAVYIVKVGHKSLKFTKR